MRKTCFLAKNCHFLSFWTPFLTVFKREIYFLSTEIIFSNVFKYKKAEKNLKQDFYGKLVQNSHLSSKMSQKAPEGPFGTPHDHGNFF